MSPSNVQLYELLLEISRGVVHLESSLDELLADARALNEELSSSLKALSSLHAIGPSTGTST
jgi:hypothetical protein